MSIPFSAVSYTHLDVYKRQMVNPSMVKPFGLSSDRDAFSRRQVVTRLRSVTLLCRIDVYKRQVNDSTDDITADRRKKIYRHDG